jgi:uncharacterized membrane protein
MQWAIATAAFLASAVEFVEAFTIVLVVGVTINWRSSLLGAFAAAATLAVIVATLGVALVRWVPINDFRLAVGIILILFGLKWLKKAILRYSGLKASTTRKPSLKKGWQKYAHAEKQLRHASNHLV